MNNVMEFLSLFNILVCGIRFFCARRREMQTPMSGTVYIYIYNYIQWPSWEFASSAVVAILAQKNLILHTNILNRDVNSIILFICGHSILS